MRLLWVLFFAMLLPAVGVEHRRVSGVSVYSGMSDASAGVALDADLFAVANDEDNVLRVYSNEKSGQPVARYPLDGFLGQTDEADLEGAARIGNRIFWIGSHGRNRNGKDRPDRHCFFATDIEWTGATPKLKTVGLPYRGLLADMLQDERLAPFHLAEAARLAPKSAEALNIEGLAATPTGQLLIAFRNPVPDGLALLVPLLNPNEVITGAHARFGDPIRVDLEGKGIRDIAAVKGGYLIISGPFDSGGKFHAFRWAGPGKKPKHLKSKQLNEFHPEAVIVYPELDDIQILSDDGKKPVDGTPGKQVIDPLLRKFRSFWLVEKES